MNEVIVNENVKIENMIYEIRGVQVMLDSDLAILYNVETKRVNEAVKRNSYKFPNRFTWVLTTKEMDNLRSQNATSSLNSNYGGRRYVYRVFTEQGVAMLATILKSKIAIQVSIQIMDAFIMMKKYISSNIYERRISNLETKYIEHDNKFDEVFSKLDNQIENNSLFFEGQIYDAYSLLVDILNTSKESIIIIDNYIDKKLLDILSRIKVDITIITNKIDTIDIEKYNKQYHNLKIEINNSFHDRFIILDNNIFYHCGASFKDLGKKCFAITKMNDSKYLDELLNKIEDKNV